MPDQDRREVPVAERVAELERWWARIREPGFSAELERMVAEVVREGAVLREARIHELKDVIREIQATRWWRLRTRLATSPLYPRKSSSGAP